MPFLAPIAAPLIIGGATVGSTLLANRGARPSEEERQALERTSQIQQTQQQLAGQLFPYAEQYLRQGQQAVSPVLNYWNRILGGDRQGITELLGPEISAIGDQYRNVLNATRTMSPRGGGSSAFFTELPFQQARDVSNLIQRVRPMAADEIARLGTNLSATGTNIAGTTGSILSGAGFGGTGLLNYGLGRSAQQFQQGQAMGQGLYDVINDIAGYIQSRGGGGGTNLIGVPRSNMSTSGIVPYNPYNVPLQPLPQIG